MQLFCDGFVFQVYAVSETPKQKTKTMKKMKTKTIGLMVVLAGLMCSCQQQQSQQSSETQGAEFDAYWNTGDSLSDMKRLQIGRAHV